jgi:hypothetical protein
VNPGPRSFTGFQTRLAHRRIFNPGLMQPGSGDSVNIGLERWEWVGFSSDRLSSTDGSRAARNHFCPAPEQTTSET